MFIKIYDEIPEEAKTIREAVFIKEQGFKDEFDGWRTTSNLSWSCYY